MKTRVEISIENNEGNVNAMKLALFFSLKTYFLAVEKAFKIKRLDYLMLNTI